MKDKNNLLDYNIWSGTNYYENITGFTKKPTSTNNWCLIGERSLKLERISDEYDEYTTEVKIMLPTGNYNFTVDIYSPESSGYLTLLTGENEQINLTFNPNKEVQHLLLHVSTNNIRYIRFSNWIIGTSVYITNMKLVLV